jgi:hypothetical protein
MEFLRKILRREKKEQKIKENIERSQKKIELEEDVIDLGWHWSENKKEWQLAKIREEDRKIHFYIVGALELENLNSLNF